MAESVCRLVLPGVHTCAPFGGQGGWLPTRWVGGEGGWAHKTARGGEPARP